MSYFNSAIEFALQGEEKEVVMLKEDYVSDTKKYIDDVLKDTDDAGAKKFLEGLKKFVEESGYLTPKQRLGLAQFNSENPENPNKK